MKKIFLFLIVVSVIAAKPLELTQIDQRIISLTFNEEFTQAKSLCFDQIKVNPGSPKYYYYLINAKIIEYYQKVAELNHDKREEGRKTLNTEIINYCEYVLDKFDESKLNTENKFYFGSVYGYLARVYGIDGSWYSAFTSAKKAKSLMEDILEADPVFYDSYLVLGMIEYYADRMGGVSGFVAGVLGLSGDREKGLNQLKLAYQKGKLTFGQTALTMIEVYSSLEGNEYAALPYFENFLKQFPNNKRTTNAYFHTLLNIWDLNKAQFILKNDKQNVLDDYARARFYDIKGNCGLAIKYGEQALQNENKLYRGGANAARYIIVINSWLIGDQVKVNKYEPELNESNKERLALVKKYEKESKWLHDLSIQLAEYKSVAEIEIFINSKPNLGSAKGYEDLFNNLTGIFYFNNKLYNKALQYFQKTMNAANDRDKFASLKYLIEIYLKQNVEKQKVEYLVEIIDDSKNERLIYRAKDLIKKYDI